MNYSKKYWSENEFTYQNGDSYEGYVGIYKGKGYIFDTEEPLIKKDSWYTEMHCSDLFFDRILDENLELPYSKDEIMVQPNDFLNKSVLTNILKKLQYNNEYIFKNSILSDTLIPAIDDCSLFASEDRSRYVFVTERDEKDNVISFVDTVTEENKNTILYKLNTKFTGEADENNLKYPLKIGDKAISFKNYKGNYQYYPDTFYKTEINNGILKHYNASSHKKTNTVLDPTFYKTKDSDSPLFNFNDITSSAMKIIKVDNNKVTVLLFIALKTKLLALRFVYDVKDFNNNSNLSFDFNNSTNILSFDTVNPNDNNSLNFLEIFNIYIHDTNLFLIDKKLNMVIRYDINTLCQEINNAFIKNNIKLLNCLQGEGSSKNQIYFKSPKAIAANDDYIYIADSGNNCIKSYNSGFNYLRTLKIGDFTNKDIQAISINPYNIVTADGINLPSNSLWVFSTNNNYLYVTIINDNKVIYSSRIAKIKLLKDEYSWTEEFKSVCFSKSNSNYYYICTTKRVYKLHTSKPNYPFASLSYFKQRTGLTSMIWNNVLQPWHGIKTFSSDDDAFTDEVTWNYMPPNSSAEVLRNHCFCLDCYDKKDESFNGDLIFHFGVLYNTSKLNDYIINNPKKLNLDFYQIPEIELSSMIECSRYVFI